jgi:hypothetical protein
MTDVQIALIYRFYTHRTQHPTNWCNPTKQLMWACPTTDQPHLSSTRTTSPRARMRLHSNPQRAWAASRAECGEARVRALSGGAPSLCRQPSSTSRVIRRTPMARVRGKLAVGCAQRGIAAGVNGKRGASEEHGRSGASPDPLDCCPRLFSPVHPWPLDCCVRPRLLPMNKAEDPFSGQGHSVIAKIVNHHRSCCNGCFFYVGFSTLPKLCLSTNGLPLLFLPSGC